MNSNHIDNRNIQNQNTIKTLSLTNQPIANSETNSIKIRNKNDSEKNELNFNNNINNNNGCNNSNINQNNSSLLKKKRSQGKIESKSYKEVDIILDLYTKVLIKEEAENCLCRNTMPDPEEFTTAENTKNIFYEREIISSLNFLVYQSDKIKLFDVISKLKSCGFPLTGAMISIYSKLAEDYVFVGADPIDQNFFISSSEYNIKLIKLRVIAYIEDKLIQNVFGEEAAADKESVSRKNSNSDKKKNKRTKERKIGYIIEKVNSWRKLYNGFQNENAKFTKYSLDEAAKIIGISKKSLDDYLLQLRLGRKFGFDFNSNKSQKVGILRSFVKQNRSQKND